MESLGRRILEEVGEKGKSGGKVGRLTLYPYKIFITLRYFQVIGAAAVVEARAVVVFRSR